MVRDGFFPSSPERVRAVWLVAGIALVGVAAWALATGTERLGAAPGPLALGAGLSGLIVIALSRIMPRKTWRGVQALDRVKGFREFLERTSKDELRRLPPDTMHKWLAWAVALGVSERWIHAFDGLPVSQPSWYVSRGGFDLDGFDRSLSRFSSGTEQALLTSRRGAGDSWSGSGGLSGGSSGGGMGGGGGSTF